MHPRHPHITVSGTVRKESDDLVILGVTFDFKMTFEKHLCFVSRAVSQRLGILIKSWRVFHDGSLLGRCFRGFVLPVFEYCSAESCSAADTQFKLLDCAVSGARLLTGGVFECDIAHRRSVAVLYILFKIRCKPMHRLNDALPGPYVPVLVTRGALVARRYTFAPPRCRTSQHRMTFVPVCVHLERYCLPRIRWCGTGGFQEHGQCFFIGLSCFILTIVLYHFSLSLLSISGLVLWGWGLRTDRVYITLS